MKDNHSFGNFEECLVKHVDLNLYINFEKKQLQGYADLTVSVLKDNVKRLVLDCRNLDIEKVVSTKKGDDVDQLIDSQLLSHKVLPVDENTPSVFGHPLEIQLTSDLKLKKGDQTVLRVYYNTTPKSEAIQWLNKEQTSGKKYPFLFTQCQAIHARSLLPIQDIPRVKSTFTATIKCDKPLKAVMSAELISSTEDETMNIFKFNQKIPIPSYLIALSVGQLESKKIGPRSTIYCEKEYLEKAAWEFDQTEEFIAAAESFLIPYKWGIYDVLCLPPSFPYGGMENPNITFITPTLLAEDKSLASVVAHEIAHSWSGNLVTNKTWEDFWLNEGFTVYIERRIIARIYSEQVAALHAMIGYTHLEDSVKLFKKMGQMEYTKLIPNLENVDPDDSFSSVPYEKGFNFLYYLTNVVGGIEVFEPFLKAYFSNFALKTVTSEQMKTFFLSYFKGKVSDEKLGTIEWDKWFYDEGLPHHKNEFDKTLANEAIALSKKVIESNGESCTKGDIEGWSSIQIVFFLSLLSDEISNDKKAFDQNLLEKMSSLYGLNDTKNAEIRFSWQMLCLSLEYEKIFDNVVKFITEQGRMKYVRPLYRSLYETKNGKQLAVETFKKNKNIYHSIASKMIEKDLKLN